MARGSGGSSSGKEAYKEHDASRYHGTRIYSGILDDKYIEITGATEEEAQKIYELNVQGFYSGNRRCAFHQDGYDQCRSDGTDFSLMAKTVLRAGKLSGGRCASEQWRYVYRYHGRSSRWFSFSEPCRRIFSSAVDDFNNRAKNGELDDLSEQEYEEAYGEAVISALEGKTSAMTRGSKINVDVVLDYDKENNVYVISDGANGGT